MDTLNQYALSQVLGSTIKPIRAPRFGNFGLLETSAAALQAQYTTPTRRTSEHLTYAEDEVIVRAFEEVRAGAAPDAIMWDTDLSSRFYHQCKALGVLAPAAVLGKRLINVRKNQSRYKKRGIVISPTTKIEPHPSALPQYAHVIEFALVRLRFRYGASIDEILLDPALASQFEEYAHEIAPEATSQELRLGALYLRKTRFLNKQEKAAIASLKSSVLDDDFTSPTRLSEVAKIAPPDAPGLIEVRDARRFLYISRNESLSAAVRSFESGKAFSIMANNFWTPQLDEITLQYIPGDEFYGVTASRWEKQLIYEREPVFNWPMRKDAA
ncbi:MAG: hypothetical protein AB7U73_19365 [Pirellulales bacterium]